MIPARTITGEMFGIMPIKPVPMLAKARIRRIAIIMNEPINDLSSPVTIFPFISANSATVPITFTFASGNNSFAAFSASLTFSEI